MRAIKSRGNASTEMAFVRILRWYGITGWRRHRPLPGTPDFVFPKKRMAFFLDGCWWHGCPACYRAPKSNRTFWKNKIETNRRRDRRVAKELRMMGWRVVRVWEHDLKSVPAGTLARILKELKGRR